MKIDLNEAIDQYCGRCKTKKEKYIGRIMGTDAVMYKPLCSCEQNESIKKGKSDKEIFEHISTPYWVHAGLKPTASDKAKVEYMKQHNMSWGDLRKERDAKYAKSEAGLKAFYEHKRQFGTNNAPEKNFGKNS